MTSQQIYTIGYGSRSLESIIKVINQFDIQFLIDVRSRPYSSFKPEFNKHNLEVRLKENQLSYVFMGDSLGGQPTDKDCYVGGRVDYERLRSKPFYLQGIDRLVKSAVKEGRRVILMCSEEKPERCHRTKLLGRTLNDKGVEIIHIDENNLEISQQEAILRVLRGQPSLFGEEFHKFTSNQSYGPKSSDQSPDDEEAV